MIVQEMLQVLLDCLMNLNVCSEERLTAVRVSTGSIGNERERTECRAGGEMGHH